LFHEVGILQQLEALLHLEQKQQEQKQQELLDEKVLQHLRDEFFRRYQCP